ncbi:hypothetical protein [Shimia sp.]|uniref:hypothetical protein n=1 Tax=Shimia sp. TaxID=1954381 RepID=UPI003565CB86
MPLARLSRHSAPALGCVIVVVTQQGRNGMDDLLGGAGIGISQSADSVIADDRGRLGYGELNARAEAVIADWGDRDWARPGSIVALPLTNDIAGITALVALLRRGISIVVLPANGADEAPPSLRRELRAIT